MANSLSFTLGFPILEEWESQITPKCTKMWKTQECVEDYDVDVRNIRNGVVDITNNVVVKCCK